MKKSVAVIAITVFALSLSACGASKADADRIEELEERIEELEEENDELRAKLKDAGEKKETKSEDSELDNFVVETSGVCGADLTWEYGNGILRIHGTGDMTDYDYNNCPWEDIKDKVGHVYVDEGVTSIGTYAFVGMKLLSKITIPESVTELRYESLSVIYATAAPAEPVTETRSPEEIKAISDENNLKYLEEAMPSFQKLVWGNKTYTGYNELYDITVK